MISPVQNVNLYEPKKLTIETKKSKGRDSEGMPYDTTILTVKSQEQDGSEKVWAHYPLTRNSQDELKKLNEVIATVYAQDSYREPKARPVAIYAAPPIGKDGDV